MALRAKKPDQTNKRLKMLVEGPAGSGKTRAALEFATAYIIDGERGTEPYYKLAQDAGSVVYGVDDGALDMGEVNKEVKSLLTERHAFRTLVIDPFTTIFRESCDRAEERVGSTFGKNVGEANKQWKRLSNSLVALDMNVIVTCHSKREYATQIVHGKNEMTCIGNTYDGPKGMDHFFDLVIELESGGRGKPSLAIVRKTRFDAFPMSDKFVWSYAEVKKRWESFAGVGTLEAESTAVQYATADQVRTLVGMIAELSLPAEITEKWLAAAGAYDYGDFTAQQMAGALAYCNQRLGNPVGPPTPLKVTVNRFLDDAASVPGLSVGMPTEKPKRGRPRKEEAQSDPLDKAGPTTPVSQTPCDGGTRIVQQNGEAIFKHGQTSPEDGQGDDGTGTFQTSTLVIAMEAKVPVKEEVAPVKQSPQPPPAPTPPAASGDPHEHIYSPSHSLEAYTLYVCAVLDGKMEEIDVRQRIAKVMTGPVLKAYGAPEVWSPERTKRNRKRVLDALMAGKIDQWGAFK